MRTQFGFTCSLFLCFVVLPRVICFDKLNEGSGLGRVCLWTVFWDVTIKTSKNFLRMIFIFPEKRNSSTGSDEVINISVLERKKVLA